VSKLKRGARVVVEAANQTVVDRVWHADGIEDGANAGEVLAAGVVMLSV